MLMIQLEDRNAMVDGPLGQAAAGGHNHNKMMAAGGKHLRTLHGQVGITDQTDPQAITRSGRCQPRPIRPFPHHSLAAPLPSLDPIPFLLGQEDKARGRSIGALQDGLQQQGEVSAESLDPRRVKKVSRIHETYAHAILAKAAEIAFKVEQGSGG